MIYIILIAVILLLTLFSEKAFIKEAPERKTTYNYFFIVLSILTLSIFAAIRNELIGVDIKTYLTPLFENAMDTGLLSFLQQNGVEPLFRILVFLSTKISNNIHFCMLIIQIIISIFFYKFAIYFSKKHNTSLIFFVFSYITLCYFESFCIIRQHLSLSILLYSLTLLDQRKFKKTIVFFIISTLFHFSSLGFILVYYFYYQSMLKNNNENVNNSIIKKVIFLLIVIFLYVKSTALITTLINFGLLPYRYIFYVRSNVYSGFGLKILLDDGIMILLICSYAVFNFLFRKESDSFKFGNKILTLALISELFSAVIYPLKRLNVFYIFIAFTFIAESYFKKRNINKNILLFRLAYILILFVYFLAIILLDKSGYHVYPYFV